MRLLPFGIVLACCAGCGGGSGSGTSSNISPSLVGIWQGQLTSPGVATPQLLEISVTSKGSNSGALGHGAVIMQGSMSSGASDATTGVISLRSTGSSPATTLAGTVSIDGSHHLVGELSGTGAAPSNSVIDLTFYTSPPPS